MSISTWTERDSFLARTVVAFVVFVERYLCQVVESISERVDVLAKGVDVGEWIKELLAAQDCAGGVEVAADRGVQWCLRGRPTPEARSPSGSSMDGR